jgi:hypothetical protein
MFIADAPDKTLVGKTIGQSAKDAHAEPLDYFMHLLEKYDEDLRWFACNANQRAEIRQKLMRHPHILPGFSDAGAHSRNLAFFDNSLSVLRQAAQTQFLPFHQAVARVTSEPAHWFNLDAGSIKIGGKADFVLLDPEKLKAPIPEASVIYDAIFNGAPRMVKRDESNAVSAVFAGGTLVVQDGLPLPILEQQRHGNVLGQINRTGSESQALELYRNRISSYDGGLTLGAPTGYWTVFLLKHQQPANVAMHCVAFILMYAIAALALYKQNLWLLLLMPLSQATGLLGHWLFERTPIDQRDTIFSWRALASLHLMFFCVLTGKYLDELARAQLALARYERANSKNHNSKQSMSSALVQQV